jgi:hypothetical protein
MASKSSNGRNTPDLIKIPHTDKTHHVLIDTEQPIISNKRKAEEYLQDSIKICRTEKTARIRQKVTSVFFLIAFTNLVHKMLRGTEQHKRKVTIVNKSLTKIRENIKKSRTLVEENKKTEKLKSTMIKFFIKNELLFGRMLEDIISRMGYDPQNSKIPHILFFILFNKVLKTMGKERATVIIMNIKTLGMKFQAEENPDEKKVIDKEIKKMMIQIFVDNEPMYNDMMKKFIEETNILKDKDSATAILLSLNIESY